MNKSLALAVIAVVVALVAGVGALTMNPASNALADSANTAQTIIVRDSNGAFAAGAVTVTSLTSSGGVQLQSQTLAVLLAAAPAAAGEVRYCNNCTPAKVLVATGTSAGNWADAAGGQFK